MNTLLDRVRGKVSVAILVSAWGAGLGRAIFHYAAPGPLSILFQCVIFVFLVLFAWRAIARAPRMLARETGAFVDMGLTLVTCVSLVALGADHVALAVIHWVLSIRAMASWPDVRRALPDVRSHPARVIVWSFAAVISLGTALLASPRAASHGDPASLVDALFTATSATCVTGLIVVDTGTFWSAFGRTVIAVLIEAGALGIMTLWAGMLILTGRRLGYVEESTLGGIVEEEAPKLLRRTVARIALWSAITQLAGALLLVPAFYRYSGDLSDAVSSGFFHAVSAFANAGFSTYTTSLEAFSGDPAVCIIVMGLIVVGGLGFPVLDEIRRAIAARVRRHRAPTLSLHAKLVLSVSLAVTLFSAVAIFHLEYDASMRALGVPEKLLASLFQAVTLRTAGFNTVPTTAFAQETLLIMMAAMFIGAAPASTGGGVKVTTLGVLLLTVRSFLRERPVVEAFGRRVPNEMVQKSIAIVLVSFAVLLFALVVLVSFEDLPFLSLAFETVSAFGTVGLSTGATGSLTTPGRLIIIALMFLGRVGPLTLALAVGRRARPVRYRYPEGRLLVG